MSERMDKKLHFLCQEYLSQEKKDRRINKLIITSRISINMEGEGESMLSLQHQQQNQFVEHFQYALWYARSPSNSMAFAHFTYK